MWTIFRNAVLLLIINVDLDLLTFVGDKRVMASCKSNASHAVAVDASRLESTFPQLCITEPPHDVFGMLPYMIIVLLSTLNIMKPVILGNNLSLVQNFEDLDFKDTGMG